MSYVKTTLTATLAVCLLGAVAPAQQPPPAPGGEVDLIGVLTSDAGTFEKAKACQSLAVVGTERAVPALAELLDDEKLAHYARFALEPMPSEAAGAALREALGTLQGGLKVGVINSIGMRRDGKAVGALRELLDDEDSAIASAAAAALGRIAAPEAVEALRAALVGPEARRPAVADALLTAADMLQADGKTEEALALYDLLRKAELPEHQRTAALDGTFRLSGESVLPLLFECLRADDEATFRVALAAAQRLKRSGVAAALVNTFEMDPGSPRAPLIIEVLGARGDREALPVVLDVARSGSGPARLSAVRVLGKIGDVSTLPLLLELAVESDEDLATAARSSLADLPGDGIDKELSARLHQSDDARMTLVLIELAGRRGLTIAAERLLQLADSDDPAIRQAAIAALGLTVGQRELPVLIDRVVEPSSPEVADAARQALATALQRVPDRDAVAIVLIERRASAPAAAQSELMDLLGVLGGAKALEAITAAARGSEADQDAASRVLGRWMTPDAAPVLLEMATAGNEKFRVRALRGYLRIARQLDVPQGERLAMARRALEAASRTEEKALALEVMARYPAAGSLAVIVPCLDDPALKAPAASAAVAIGEKLADANPDRVAQAMDAVIQAGGDAELIARARAVRDRANAKSR